MRRILIIGFGDVARRLVPLLGKGYRVYGLIRNPAQVDALRALDVVPVLGDLDQPTSLRRLAGLAHVVIHLAPPPPHGTIDARTRNLLSVLSRTPTTSRPGSPCEYSQRRRMLPQRLVYISTSGVYGDCGGAPVDETRRINPQSPRAVRRADAEARVRYWGAGPDREVCILRVPGIYAADRLPLERLQRGTPALRADEDSHTNHIHADDLARAIVAAIQRGQPARIYNCSDDSALRMGDYFDLVADCHGLPRPARISRAEAETTLPEALLSFMRESRQLDNRRLKEELRFRLRYPTVAAGLNSRGDTRRL